MRIIVASRNPVKLNAVTRGFRAMFGEGRFDVEGVTVSSDVAAQPIGGKEIFDGARNRAHNARAMHPDADYWVGLEGGNDRTENGTEVYAWIVVLSRDGRMGIGRTCAFLLPPKLVELIEGGMELNDADAQYFGRGLAGDTNGTIGHLTGDAVDRTTSYEHAVILALIPFKHPTHYPL